jgi:DNA repair exonuclease SbcCD ATPase subunit
MTVSINNISLKNFLSTGNVTQTVVFNQKNLTLILGDNLDLGSNGARNGVGKTVIAQAISYALYGEPINKIKQDNLINRTNGKNMLVTIDFSVNGNDYRIERGRKPNVLRFYVNNVEHKNNESQGENRETQDQIVDLLKMSHVMFKNLVILNTYTEPFLSMKAPDQREIIEQLLGISLLSEKAENLKEKVKTTKLLIQQEDFKIKTIEESNKKVSEQIDNLKKRQSIWINKYNTDVNNITVEYNKLSNINFEEELLNHEKLKEYKVTINRIEKYKSLLKLEDKWKINQNTKISEFKKKFDKLNSIDISQELLNHNLLEEYNTKLNESTVHATSISKLVKEIATIEKTITRLEKECDSLKRNVCHACNQEIHNHTHEELLSSKLKELQDQVEANEKLKNELSDLQNNPIVLPDKPTVHYSNKNEAFLHYTELEKLQQSIDNVTSETSPYLSQLSEYNDIDVGMDISEPKTIYESESEAIKAFSKLEMLEKQLEKLLSESDPYEDQIREMENKSLSKVTYDRINELTVLQDHQKFLIDLLTNKDSFIRKKIIDKNLSYLNSRLKYYLQSIGLPHTVVFKNDLSVEISEIGRELDFANLSRGEGNRLIISLSLAFRDVYESMFNSINMLMIDELMDSGMDTVGTDNCLMLLKDLTRSRNKSVLLISHKDELINRVDNVLKVVKQNGFTEYNIN